ncbi:hypothetical protein [Polaromonas jejuensis]|uniref:Uncharacterized protein n=1 Tax=Polaromonas jejuensis TaxID=457502 RepID=A0ABW0QA31_9BURK|nr:hypothetical protein [Polaromonas jejuensis]
MNLDSDLLRALCALAMLGLPFGVAWWIAGRDVKPKRRRGDEPTLDDPKEATPVVPFRRDL